MSNTTLVEWFSAHYYKVIVGETSRLIPSVTTKLGVIDKPNLSRWRGDIGNREADLRMYDAAQRGTRIHWAYATALKGGAVVYDPWNKPVYTEEGIAELRKAHGEIAILRTQEEQWDICKLAEQYKRLAPEVLGVEETVYDLDTDDAGTIDNIFAISGGEYFISGSKPLILPLGIYIGDLKTGKYIDDNVWLQIAPYAYMWEKKTGKKVAGGLVTHTGSTIKSGIPGLKTLYRPREKLFDVDYADYRHAAKLWERNHQDDQPETFQFPSLITMKVKEAV